MGGFFVSCAIDKWLRGGENMKKLLTVLLSVLVVFSLVGCGSKDSDSISIAVPNDTTNEARALLLLENLGVIKLKEGAGIVATKNDIVENPYNFEIQEVEAAQIPNIKQDVDFAIINSNYAIDAGLNPSKDALALEGSFSAYANILAVKQGRENDELVLALVQALESKEVQDFINEKYAGAVVSTVDNPVTEIKTTATGKISVAASPTPHAEILEIAKKLLAEKNIELEIIEFTDYVQPNNVVEAGDVDANYFQHVPYLDDFNVQNGTHIVSVAAIHVEPMGIYGGKLNSLDVFSK